MLLEAAQALDLDLARSWMFGDSDSDIVAGRAAGCHTALIDYPDSAHRRGGAAAPEASGSDLAAAVRSALET
jgi:phosphoglycolate phosphatase-like HAD superfamily hydrolase